MVELLEKWGNLPEGSTELLKNATLQNATREHLQKFAEELGDEIAIAHQLKETNLDLDKLRWPVSVTVLDNWKAPVAHDVVAVIDRMGRYFFRAQDIKKEWFVPGFTLVRDPKAAHEVILEATPLFVEDQVVAIQVTTTKS